MTQHSQHSSHTFYLKYDSEWEVWVLWQHTKGEIDHSLAEFSDGTPEKPPQLAENVLDLLTSPNKKEHNENEEGTHDQT